MSAWDVLGYDWDKVRTETEKRGVAFTVKETAPPGDAVLLEKKRVVRVREMNGQMEYIVAAEKVERATPSY